MCGQGHTRGSLGSTYRGESQVDYTIPDTTASPVIWSARRLAHSRAICGAVAWKSSRSNCRMLAIRCVVGANSMALAHGFGVSHATRRAYRLTCARTRLAHSYVDLQSAPMSYSKPGTLGRWGLGPDKLRATNPGLIFTRVSGVFAPRLRYRLSFHKWIPRREDGRAQWTAS